MDLMERMNNAQPKFTSYEPIPVGSYTAEIVKAEVKQETDINGPVIKYNLEMVVKDGEYAGRKLWYSPQIRSNTSDERVGVITGMLYSFAGVKTSEGKTLTEIVQSSQGNWVKFNLGYKPNVNNPEKPYTNFSKIETTVPF